MHIPTYFFQNLESIYYFRMRVPTDLRPIFNRTELKKSLRTKSKTVALRRCRRYVVATEQVFTSGSTDKNGRQSMQLTVYRRNQW